MADVRGVLLVPAKGDPGGLLAKGACHSLPPSVERYTGWHRWCSPSWYDTVDELALPLWWDGAMVPGGWSRAREAAMARPMATGLWLQLGHWGPGRVPDLAAAMLLAEELVAVGWGARVVLVDAYGREVTL